MDMRGTPGYTYVVNVNYALQRPLDERGRDELLLFAHAARTNNPCAIAHAAHVAHQDRWLCLGLSTGEMDNRAHDVLYQLVTQSLLWRGDVKWYTFATPLLRYQHPAARRPFEPWLPRGPQTTDGKHVNSAAIDMRTASAMTVRRAEFLYASVFSRTCIAGMPEACARISVMACIAALRTSNERDVFSALERESQDRQRAPGSTVVVLRHTVPVPDEQDCTSLHCDLPSNEQTQDGLASIVAPLALIEDARVVVQRAPALDGVCVQMSPLGVDAN